MFKISEEDFLELLRQAYKAGLSGYINIVRNNSDFHINKIFNVWLSNGVPDDEPIAEHDDFDHSDENEKYDHDGLDELREYYNRFYNKSPLNTNEDTK